MRRGLLVAAMGCSALAASLEARAADGATVRPAVLVDLNAAGIDELSRLPGLGRKRAADIVLHRVQYPFRRVTDLLRVRGIGRKTFQKLKPFVRVGSGPVVPPAPTASSEAQPAASPG